MEMIPTDAKKWRVIKDYFPYIMVVLLMTANVYQAQKLETAYKDLIKSEREQKEFFKDGYNNSLLLLKILEHERPKIIDTVYSTNAELQNRR